MYAWNHEIENIFEHHNNFLYLKQITMQYQKKSVKNERQFIWKDRKSKALQKSK